MTVTMKEMLTLKPSLKAPEPCYIHYVANGIWILDQSHPYVLVKNFIPDFVPLCYYNDLSGRLSSIFWNMTVWVYALIQC